jgi:uncharacterized protein (TIGR03118 family)
MAEEKGPRVGVRRAPDAFVKISNEELLMTASSPIARHVLRLAALTFGLALSTAIIAASPNSYQVHNLVSDVAGQADHTDTNLVNGWGVAFNPNGFVWVADNGTGVATLYDGLGNPQSLVVSIPTASGSGQGVPTGITFNSSNDFQVSNGGTPAAARFLFATEDGAIAGWAPSVDFTHAIIAVTPAAVSPAVYKGIAIAGNGGSHLQLYAADFHNSKIDVFDSTFAPTTAPGGFADPGIPVGFAPFNIMNIQGDLYVAFAQREVGGDDEVAGPGLGFVDVFDADGFLIRRVASRGKLNAPWGMALAPAGFGKFSNHLLVGNFGDGTINAYNLKNGTFAGQLHTSNGQVLKIDGLWGIAFGNGILDQQTDVLFFAAGPDDESHGLYGRIEPAP